MKSPKSLLFLIALFSIFITSCKEDETLKIPDYASAIAGVYNGNITIGTISAPSSTTVTKNTEVLVDLSFLIGTTVVPLNLVTVTEKGNNSYTLSYGGQTEGSFVGEVHGNTLTWTLVFNDQTQVFTGTK